MGEECRLSKSKKNLGYSLIELLVILLIIGILCSILLVSFFYVQEKQNEKKAYLELSALEVGITSYFREFGDFPNCPEGVCTPGECLFLSMVGFHNAKGGLEIPPQRSSLPVGLFGFDPVVFDVAEIPDFSHSDGNSLKVWVSNILAKDPSFLDPWGNEYQYEYPRKDRVGGYKIFSLGPNGETGGKFSEDDIFPL